MHAGVFIFLGLGVIFRFTSIAYFLCSEKLLNNGDENLKGVVQDIIVEFGFLPFFAANILFVSHLLIATLNLEVKTGTPHQKPHLITVAFVRKFRFCLLFFVCLVNLVLFGLALTEPEDGNEKILDLLLQIQLGIHVAICALSAGLVLFVGLNFRKQVSSLIHNNLFSFFNTQIVVFKPPPNIPNFADISSSGSSGGRSSLASWHCGCSSPRYVV